MNRITITGRLTRDPELQSLPSGDPVCKLRLAVDDMVGRGETGYIDVASYGASGEAAAKVLTKGYLVAVDGRVRFRTWEQDGQKRHDYDVVGHVEFLAAPKGDANSNGNGDTAAAGDPTDAEPAEAPVEEEIAF
jgi:single-strand DNA-binding protein